MTLKVAAVFLSQHGLLPLYANVAAEGTRKACSHPSFPGTPCQLVVLRLSGGVRRQGLQVQGAEVTVYRIKDPVRPDDSTDFDEGVLEAPLVSKQACFLASRRHNFISRGKQGV